MDSKKNDRRPKDRNANQPQNGQMMTELKYLKAQLAVKDKHIKELEEQLAVAVVKLKEAQAAQDPIGEIIKLADSPAVAKLAATPVP